jgi:hypothetical protein
MKPSKPRPSARRVTSVPPAKKTLIGPAKPMTVAQRRATTAPIPNAKGPRITTNEKKIAAELSPKGMKKSAKNQSDALDKKYPGLYKKKK